MKEEETSQGWFRWWMPAATGALALVGIGAFVLSGGNDARYGREQRPAGATGDGVTGPVTFLELGSVGCIPCEKMKPVMKGIEEKYGDRVKVEFHDVRVEHKIAQQYKISLIPTQVFLDANGKEFARHQGFFEQGAIESMLASKGILPPGAGR